MLHSEVMEEPSPLNPLICYTVTLCVLRRASQMLSSGYETFLKAHVCIITVHVLSEQQHTDI